MSSSLSSLASSFFSSAGAASAAPPAAAPPEEAAAAPPEEAAPPDGTEASLEAPSEMSWKGRRKIVSGLCLLRCFGSFFEADLGLGLRLGWCGEEAWGQGRRRVRRLNDRWDDDFDDGVRKERASRKVQDQGSCSSISRSRSQMSVSERQSPSPPASPRNNHSSS